MGNRIQVYLDHDIIIRHFILSGSLTELVKKFELQYVFPDNDKRVTFDLDSLKLSNVIRIPVDRERLGQLRQLSKVRTIRTAKKNKAYQFVDEQWRVLFDERVYRKMRRMAKPWNFWRYRRRVLKRAGPYPEMEKAIDAFRPDLVLHPSVLEGLFISDLAGLTKQKKIPFIALMNSWDNPSTKAMIIGPPDCLAVWGEQTKRHAIEFLGMRPPNVKILGAAQFDVYRRSPSKSRDDLCREMNISPGKALILYGGSSKSVNEMKHLLLLDDAVAKGELGESHVIFRPHPWRAPAPDEPDFFDIPWKHVTMDPSMKAHYNSPKRPRERSVHLTDYMDTHNILSAADLLVNNVSTILLEAAIHGKPSLCMVSEEDITDSNHLRVIYTSIFFQELLHRLDIPTCKDYADLPRLCRNLLEQSQKPGYREDILERIRYFIDLGNEPYSTRVTRLVEEFLSTRAE